MFLHGTSPYSERHQPDFARRLDGSFFLREDDDVMSGGGLNAAEFSADCGKITPELPRMLHTVLSHFLNNWILHLSFRKKSTFFREACQSFFEGGRRQKLSPKGI